MQNSFDLLVLGAGSGGLAAAKRAANYGAKVAIVEGDRVGGTCVIRGCIPKKLLVYGSAYRHLLADAASYGWELAGYQPNPSSLLAHVRAEVDRLNVLHLGLLEKAGVQLISGWGSFVDAHTIAVQGARSREGTEMEHYSAGRILIGVGGRPQRPAIPGSELGWVSDQMFLLEDLPKRMVVVGAGFIACEFACILHGLGVEVTQLVRGEQILRGFDHEAANAVQEAMVAEGIDICTDTSPVAITGKPGALTVGTARAGRKAAGENIDRAAPIPLVCGGVLLATGRKPFLEGLQLEKAGVQIKANRIVVDDNQRTNVPHIYAVGDVTDRINLTPVAIDEGRAFADSVYGNKPRKVNHELVAMAVFSQPELATVGLSEAQAIARHGSDGIGVHRARFRPLVQALPKRGPTVLLKLVTEGSAGRVLGCHMVGEHSAEIIQMAAIAIAMGATKADFDRTMALHPSVAEEFVTMPN